MTTALPFLPQSPTPLSNGISNAKTANQNLAASAQLNQSQSASTTSQVDQQSSGADQAPKDFSSWLSSGGAQVADKQPAVNVPAGTDVSNDPSVILDPTNLASSASVLLQNIDQSTLLTSGINLTSKQVLHSAHFVSQVQGVSVQDQLASDVIGADLVSSEPDTLIDGSQGSFKKDTSSSLLSKNKPQLAPGVTQVVVDPAMLQTLTTVASNVSLTDGSFTDETQGSLSSGSTNSSTTTFIDNSAKSVLTGTPSTTITSQGVTQSALTSPNSKATSLPVAVTSSNKQSIIPNIQSSGKVSELKVSNTQPISTKDASLLGDNNLRNLDLTAASLSSEDLGTTQIVTPRLQALVSNTNTQLVSDSVTLGNSNSAAISNIDAVNSAKLSTSSSTADRLDLISLSQNRISEQVDLLNKRADQRLIDLNSDQLVPQDVKLQDLTKNVLTPAGMQSDNPTTVQVANTYGSVAANVSNLAVGGEKSAGHNSGMGSHSQSKGRLQDKNLLNTGDNVVTNTTSLNGTTAATHQVAMPYSSQMHASMAASMPVDTSSTRSAALDARKMNTQLPVTSAQAKAAVEQVNKLIDSHLTQSENLSKTINLGFKFGDSDVGLKVQVKDGTILTQFSTNSNEIRAALSAEWQSSGFSSKNHNFQFAEPTFSSTTGGNSQNPFNSQDNTNPQYQSYDGSFASLASQSNIRATSTLVSEQTSDEAPSIQEGQLRTFA